MQKLRELLDQLPEPLAREALTHSSWTQKREESYERMAFLGDSVLALSVTVHLYPRPIGPGKLTKLRAQAVSGRSCRVVAERLGVPDRMREVAGRSDAVAETLVNNERVLASVIEAVIGACYLQFGYDKTAEAVVEAFGPEIEQALESPADFKSALQEELARQGEQVSYVVTSEEGPPHDRSFEVAAMIGEEEVARGAGRSKKDAEQAAAALVLEKLSE